MRIKDESKRLAIKEATLNVVFMHGFAGIKMADLAKQVGLSVSTIYVYYKHKNDLITSIAIELIQKTTTGSAKNIADDLPYKIKLQMLWNFWVYYSFNNDKEMSFLAQLKKSPYYNDVPKSIRDEKFKIGFELFDLGKKEGLLKNLDNAILTSITGALLNETVKMMFENTIPNNKESTDMMFSLLWDSIKS